MRRLRVLVIVAALACVGAPPAEAQRAPEAGAARSPSPRLVELWERADRQDLHDDLQWLALLHYEKRSVLSGARSAVQTRSFFLSEQGDRDPRAELHATLRALVDAEARTDSGEPLQCAFIARRHWLAQRLQLGTEDLPAIECPSYERWRADLDARGLTLIFPEGFMNNPASIFGHTLLRIDVAQKAGPEEVLGWAVDFTARTEDDPVLVYMARGVLGSYPASFGVRPYYEQLKRYSDWENRDIWEYRLDIDAEQLDFVLMHLWELQGIEFPYYFFTRNCSYELLRLLEIGIPDLDASAGFHGPVIPVDTVRAITERPGLVTDTRYRPSPETKLRTALRALSRRDRKRVEDIVQSRLDPADETLEELPLARRARILDVAYDQLRYAYLAGDVSDAASRGLSRRILIARSRLGDSPESTVQVEVPEVSPDQGHDSSLFAMGAGWRDHEAFVDLRLRPAFHDLMDNGGGYLEAMQVRLLDTRLRVYPESGRVRLQELTLFDVASLTPRSRIFRPWAWSIGTGLRTRRIPEHGEHGELEDASVWGTQFGAGLAYDPAPGLLLYGLADARIDVGPDLEDSVSVGPGARLGMFAGRREARWRGHLFGEVTRFALGDTTTQLRGGGALRLTTSRNTALTLECSVNRAYGETWLDTSLQMSFHF